MVRADRENETHGHPSIEFSHVYRLGSVCNVSRLHDGISAPEMAYYPRYVKRAR